MLRAASSPRWPALSLDGHHASSQGAPAQRRPAAAPHASGGLTAFRSDASAAVPARPSPRGRAGAGASPAAPLPPTRADGRLIGSRFSSASAGITNTQEADVDEGGIVKVQRRHARHPAPRTAVHRLDRRRRHAAGRFDQRLPARRERAQGDWYDEMLLSGDRVVVIGYSYARGGTEINRFRLDPAGRLASRTPITCAPTIIIRRATMPRG